MSHHHIEKLSRPFLIAITIIVISTTSEAFDYTVGGSSGWNNKGTDYQSWSFSHNFYVHDFLFFTYDPQAHNVVQVSSRVELKVCSSTSPIAIYNTGSDWIELNRTGNYYFYCRIGDMCRQGQKLEVSVQDNRISLAPPQLQHTPHVTIVSTSTSSPLFDQYTMISTLAWSCAAMLFLMLSL